MKLNKKIKIKISDKPIKYDSALQEMKDHLSLMKVNKSEELIWFLEHDCIFTAGTSAKNEDQQIFDKSLIRYTGRGGQWTWHGHGQRVVYIMLDLKKREQDIRKFIKLLQKWIISTLNDFSIKGQTIDGYPGVWINKNNLNFKIASIGIRITNWITWHGISINLNPDLNYFNQINPCGTNSINVTSIENEGINISLKELDFSLKNNFKKYF
tara:strand:- start:216 stop:848 length:633 start_codon:yes stop_codon:yes gene_type:complete